MVLAAITFADFGQTLHYQFVNFDDGEYVAKNPVVAQGLTFRGLAWAFSRPHCGNWHPVTWISHMLDCQWYGLEPGGHHLTNVFLHTATAIALLLALLRLTGALWCSAFVAAVFAIHPLRVESVAWVSERKDVLSGLFFMLTLWAYARYAEQKTEDRKQKAEGRRQKAVEATENQPSQPVEDEHRTSNIERRKSSGQHRLLHGTNSLEVRSSMFNVRCLASWFSTPSSFYTLTLVFFALGLMSKPMLVTLPFVLLLLDYWPLRRFEVENQKSKIKNLQALLWEKVPFLALSGGCGLVTLFAQRSAMTSFESFPLAARIGAALLSCKVYLLQMAYPAGLAAFYPFPVHISGRNPAMAGLLLLALSAIAWQERRAQPWLLVGWLWYLVMLLPVLGLVQVGGQAHADRYTYLPQIGIYVAVTWLAADLAAKRRLGPLPIGALMALLVAILMACTWKQTAYWKNSETLWRHALACTRGNTLAYVNLGHELFEQRRLDEAISHYQKGLEIQPNNRQFHNNLANALREQGRLDEAIVHYERAVQIDPDSAEAQFNLGKALGLEGKQAEAIARYENALQIQPNLLPARMSLGNALVQQGKADLAAVHFQKVLEVLPNDAGAHLNLGLCFFQMGRIEAAKSEYEKALQSAPVDPGILNNLAWLLATCPVAGLRDGSKAIQLAEQANALTGGTKPLIVRTLAAALAEAGRFPEAAEMAQRASSLAEAQTIPDLAKQIEFELNLYRVSKAFPCPKPNR